MDKFYYTYTTSIGPVTLQATQQYLLRVVPGVVTLEGTCAPTTLTNTAANQLHEYLAGKRRVFDLPYKVDGTPFQQACWECLASIPYGQVRTYADVAASAGHAGASRAVGSAMKVNPLPIILPCHRVVPAGGGIGGYAYGAQLKEFLLNLEKTHE